MRRHAILDAGISQVEWDSQIAYVEGRLMTPKELKKLEAIIAKIETLQNQTESRNARSRLGAAKDELLRLHREAA